MFGELPVSLLSIWLYSQTPGSKPDPTTSQPRDLVKLVNHYVPQFPHLQTRHNNTNDNHNHNKMLLILPHLILTKPYENRYCYYITMRIYIHTHIYMYI